MTCAVCKEPGKRFTMFPSKKRAEFVENLCKKCATVRKYEDLRLAEEKARIKRAHSVAPCSDYLVSTDEGEE